MSRSWLRRGPCHAAGCVEDCTRTGARARVHENSKNEKLLSSPHFRKLEPRAPRAFPLRHFILLRLEQAQGDCDCHPTTPASHSVSTACSICLHISVPFEGQSLSRRAAPSSASGLYKRRKKERCRSPPCHRPPPPSEGCGCRRSPRLAPLVLGTPPPLPAPPPPRSVRSLSRRPSTRFAAPQLTS